MPNDTPSTAPPSSSSSSLPHAGVKQYALVPKAKPFLVENYAGTANSVTSNIREQLLAVYESYAEAYPNAALQEENQERDRLLRAVSAADHAVQLNPVPKKSNNRWLGGIFGGGKKENEKILSSKNDEVNSVEDDRLKYTDIGVAEDGLLLGTEFSLDTANIPEEAHAVARLHLCNSRKTPNVARTTWETAGTSCIAITGLGTVVEFKGSIGGIAQQTSDRLHLLDYFSEQQKNSSWNVSQARAATIGPNLLMVSWGIDGAVLFYRRIAAAEGDATVWQAVAVLSPTQAVQENLADVFSEEEGDSALLSVTDLVPLVVELKDRAPAATLVVARLGGFLELVPLPPQMWYGPELQRKQRSKTAKRKHGEHYAVGKLPDLASNQSNGITALTTTDYHTDVMGLEAFRTSVDPNDSSVEWDQAAYPNGPPAEYVLAAYGTRQESGHEIITLWSASTILTDTSKANHGVGFSLHATLTEALDLGKVGPDITLFASPTILRHWRKPRNVELRVESPTPLSNADTKIPRVTTLSVSAPIVSMRFLVLPGDGASLTVRAAVLDWNGGATVLDCDLLEKVVSQSLTDELYSILYKDENADTVQPLVEVVADRSQGMQQFATSQDSRSIPLSISGMEWFHNATPASSRNSFALAALICDPCSLRIVFSPSFLGSGSDGGTSLDTTIVPCLKNGVGTMLRYGGRNNTLYLIFQSLLKNQRYDTHLIYCALQEVNPRDIIQSLARSSQFRDAIAAAASLTASEQASITEVIEKCKKNLWESDLDFSALEAIKDDAYVVREAIYSSQPGGHQQAPLIRNGDVALLRSVYRLALKRVQSARLGASLAIAGSIEESKSMANEIKRNLIKLGTYVLLCQYLSCEPSLVQFTQDFLPASLIDLAMSFARTADIIPLSVICFRHRQDILLQSFKVVDAIPLSVTPRSYQHLLPVLKDRNAQQFTQFMAGTDHDQLLDLPEMTEYMRRYFDFSLVVDHQDKGLIVECSLKTSTASESNGGSLKSELCILEDWYTHRAQAIQHFVTSIGHISYFSRLALRGLRVDSIAETLDALASPSIMTLYRLTRFSETMRTIYPDENDSKLLSTLSVLAPEGFDVMDTKDIVALVMDCKEGDVNLLARYNQYLLPLMKEKVYARESGDLQSEIEIAFHLFCRGLVTDCAENVASKACDLLDAVNMCSSISWLSRTSVEQSTRIIKSKGELISFVVSIFGEVIETCSTMQLSQSDQMHVLDALWKMYESLPIALPPGEALAGKLGELLKTVDLLYDTLVFFDVVIRWPGSTAFALMRGRNTLFAADWAWYSADGVGENAVAMLCHSFCEQIGANNHNARESLHASSLLLALLGDVNELNITCFKGALPLTHLFSTHLCKPLLVQKEIGILGDFLSHANPEVVDSESISREVLLFFNEAVYGSTSSFDHGSSLSGAIECQDVLGNWLPGLRREFQAIRQYLDAAHYINTVLLSDKGSNLRPEEIRKMHPLDVIEFVLEKNPESLVLNSVEWKDPLWAQKANGIIRLHATSNSNNGVSDESALRGEDIPPLPGQPVFHLAQLLGLKDMSSVIVVKSRVVHYGVASKLYGAAAAICRTLIVDTAASNGDSMPVLDAVAKIVSRQEYGDVATKRELCSSVLAKNSGYLSASKSEPFSAILNVWNGIEHHDLILQRKTNSALVSVNLFFFDTRKEYSANLGELFWTLHRQLSDCVVDDTLLNALARYGFFWCIGRSTRLNSKPIGPLETPCTSAIIALAASLILHIRDGEISQACQNEMATIFGSQKYAALKVNFSLPGLNWTKPNYDIVKGLVARGYSECGAQQATVTTSNVGFNEALRWAVTHSLDAGFDDPIVTTKPAKESFVDNESASYLEATFALIEQIQSGSKPLETVELVWKSENVASGPLVVMETKKGADSMRHASPPLRPTQVAIAVNDDVTTPEQWPPTHFDSGLTTACSPSPAVPATSEVSSNIFTSLETLNVVEFACSGQAAHSGNLLTSPSLYAPSSGSLLDPGDLSTEIHRTSVRTGVSATKLRVPVPSRIKAPGKSGLKVSTKVDLKISPLAAQKVETSTADGIAPCSAAARHVTPSRDMRKAAPSSAPAPSPDRRTLMQVGQTAFRTARTIPSPTTEERKRLIEEGRLLLQRARSSSAEPAQRFFLRSPDDFAKPTLTPTSHPVPNLPPVQTAQSPSAPPVTKASPAAADEWDFDEADLDI